MIDKRLSVSDEQTGFSFLRKNCPFMLFNISEMGSFFWLSLQNFRPKSTKVESEDRKVFT